MKLNNYDSSPTFLSPPSRVTLQESANGFTIVVQNLVWWKRLTHYLVLLVGNGLALLLLWNLSRHGFMGVTPFYSFSPALFGWLAANWYLTPWAIAKTNSVTCFKVERRTLTIIFSKFEDTDSISVENITHVYCVRDLQGGDSPTAEYYVGVGNGARNDVRVLQGFDTNYAIIRYIVWKVRQHLNLPDVPTPQEYVPLTAGKMIFLPIRSHIFIMGAVLFICTGGPYWQRGDAGVLYWTGGAAYERWQGLESLVASNRTAMATVTHKNLVADGERKGKHIYYISYRYQATLPDGTHQTFSYKQRVEAEYYERTPQGAEIEVIYATQHPEVNRIADQFSPKKVAWAAYEQYFLSALIWHLGLLITVLTIFYQSYQLWLMYQLARHGKVITAVVSATKHRTWSYKGNTSHARDVYYRYLDYETRFDAPEAVFAQMRVGQPLEIRYLPDLPHVSQPHPVEKYTVWRIL